MRSKRCPSSSSPRTRWTPALRVSNDREYYKGGQEQMWRVPVGEEPSLYTEAEGWKYLRIWGMGIASRDIDLDGYDKMPPEQYQRLKESYKGSYAFRDKRRRDALAGQLLQAGLPK